MSNHPAQAARPSGQVLIGAAVGGLPVSGMCLWARMVNADFMDAPVSFLVLAWLPVLLLGALCGAWLGRAWAPSHRARVVGATLLAMQALVPLLPAPDHAPVDSRLVILGVDGATWELVDSLDLPNLKALQARGTRAVLRSREPLFSPLLWTSMATGKVPEEHGIRGFRVRGDQVQAARLWDIALDAGISQGIYKWLVTWPPTEVDGFMVPAWLAPEPDTHPPDLGFVKELELANRLSRTRVEGSRSRVTLALDGISQGLRWSTLLDAGTWAVRETVGDPEPALRGWRLQLLRAAIDRDVFLAQLRRHQPDLATFTTYATDALGHTHWVHMESGDSLSDAIPSAYRQADAILGEILDVVSPETTVLVVSDHGFRAMDERDAGRHFAPRTERLQARIAAEMGQVEVAKVGQKLTVSLLGPDPTAQREALEAWLPSLVQASTEAPFFRWEDIPDSPGVLGLTLRDERVDQQRLDTDQVGGEPISQYVRATRAYSGEHDMNGIWLAAGPDIPVGVREDPVELLDVAPTILTLLELPAAQDMPGRVVLGEERPRVETYDALRPATEDTPDGPAEVPEEQLRLLGYMD
ncbi:MAG: alkaline phosphatase family protein [Myxococcota bacterium]|jgi:hypothetical protein|nr:alkaline phosphatase family protein [Myxococcota bacterium]